MEDRLYFSVQGRSCYVFLQNDTVDDFVRNPDGSIRMDIAMEYDGSGYHRVGFDNRTANTFSGFVVCLEKKAEEAEKLLKGSAADLRVEDSNTDGLMLINTRTGKAMSCRALLKDYLSTFNFLSERPDKLTIYLSLPPEYDEMQKSQFIKILKTVTTARIVYTNPFYGLFIEACNPQAEFTRESVADTSVVILSLGYYYSVVSVVNYHNQLSVRSSIVSTSLSIKNLIRMVSESIINEQLSDLARDWTEAERAETILELMKLVLCSPTDIGDGDRVDIDFGNMPRGQRRSLVITINHFNQCVQFINELNNVIDALLRKAGLTLNDILRFGIYSELNVHSMVSNTIARKVGQDKLSILGNSGEDYLIVGLLWLQSLFDDSLVDGDSLIRNDLPPTRIGSPPPVYTDSLPPLPLPPTAVESSSPPLVSFPAKAGSSHSIPAQGSAAHTPSGTIGSPIPGVVKDSIDADDDPDWEDPDTNIIVTDIDTDEDDVHIETSSVNDPFLKSHSSSDLQLTQTTGSLRDGLVPAVQPTEPPTGTDYPDPSPQLGHSSSFSELSAVAPPVVNPTPGIKIPAPLNFQSVANPPSTDISSTIDIEKIPEAPQLFPSSPSAIHRLSITTDTYAVPLDS